MSILKGFAEIAVLIDNQDDVVSPIGEISADSASFVRGTKVFTSASHPGLAYINLQSLADDSVTIDPITLPQSTAMLDLILWIHTNAQSGQIGPSESAFIQLFETQYSGTYSLLRSGNHINVSNFWYPTSITFCPFGREAVDAWTIWFSDSALNNEFDVTLIYVIPPFEDLDQFFGTPAVVNAQLAAVTPVDFIDKVDTIRGIYPYTLLRTDEFTWHSLTNPKVLIPTYWSVVIYGRQGNNIDKIKEAIVAYVLANSNHSIEEWGEIFPDIFRSTEMIAAPLYFNYGMTPQQTERGMYSAIGFNPDALTTLQAAAKGHGYSDALIALGVTTLPCNYRSLTVAVTMGPENRPGYKFFRSLYGDYINVPPTQINDFMRMDELTREFVMVFNTMLMEAETLTPSSAIPVGYTRVQRDGIWYLAKNHNDLLILVTTKYSIDRIATDLSLPSDVE